jgi:hypothetical protein
MSIASPGNSFFPDGRVLNEAERNRTAGPAAINQSQKGGCPMRTIACAAALILALSFSGNVLADDQSKASASDLKKQAEQTLETAKKYTAQQKELYQKKAETELSELGDRISELKKRSETLRGEALQGLEAKFKDFKEKHKAAEKKLSELKSSTAQAWQDAKTGVDNAVGALKSSYDNILKNFK